ADPGLAFPPASSGSKTAFTEPPCACQPVRLVSNEPLLRRFCAAAVAAPLAIAAAKRSNRRAFPRVGFTGLRCQRRVPLPTFNELSKMRKSANIGFRAQHKPRKGRRPRRKHAPRQRRPPAQLPVKFLT